MLGAFFVSPVVADARSAAGQAPASHVGARLAEHHARGDLYAPSPPDRSAMSATEAIRQALADPSSVSERSLRMEPVPNPDSARFQAWARMRFGVLA